jgi:hypothetical protein
MTEIDLEQLLRRIVREELERARQRDVEPQHIDALRVAVAMYQIGDVFTASELIDEARFYPAHREVLRVACDNDSQRLGIYLGKAADAGVVVDRRRLRRRPKEAGVWRWVLVGVDPL